MNYRQIMQDIKKNNINKVYLFYGEEDYLIDNTVKYIKNKNIGKNLEYLNYTLLDSDDIVMDDIYNACETLPFMSEKKMVVVKDLGIFASKKKDDKNDEDKNINKDDFGEMLSDYILTLEEYVILVFVERINKIDSRKKLVKNIKKVGSVLEFKKLRGKELDNCVEKFFIERNKKISRANISYFIQNSSYLEYNANKTLYDLENEIIKLCNYSGDKQEITKDDIDRVSSRFLQNNVFKLLDGIINKNATEALKVFNEMILSNQPIPVILHMIIRQLRLMMMMILMRQKGYNNSKIMSKLGIKEYEFKKISLQCRHYTINEIEENLKKCLSVDKNIKNGSMGSRVAVEMLIIELAN